MNAIVKSSINIADGAFNDVFYVPHLSNNLLSIYRMTRKIMEFTPNPLLTKDLEMKEIIAATMVDPACWLYTFKEFAPNEGFDPLV